MTGKDRDLLPIRLADGPTVRTAMEAMTETHTGLVPVADGEGRLAGIVADGDLRRALLAGLTLDAPLADILNRNPVVATADMEEHEISRLMRETNKFCVPVVDAGRRLLRLAVVERPLLPNCVPCLEGREQTYTAEAVLGGWLAIGPFISRIENAIAGYLEVPHAVAVSSGTAALHLALLVAGVRRDDLVLMPALTFVATANAVAYCGASPVFFDCEACSWGMDPDQLAEFLGERAERSEEGARDRRTGRLIGAILPVHLYGHPVDLDRIRALADDWGIPLVEDSAEALGARYRNRPVGAEGGLGVLSFNGNKIITGGAGGMVLTDDAGQADRLRHLAAQARTGDAGFLHDEVGFNYRMPNLNAAVLLAQFEMLGEFVDRKRRVAGRYRELLADIDGVEIRGEADWASCSHWMALLTLDAERFPDGAGPLLRFLPGRGIEARAVWCPMNRQAAFREAESLPTPVADRLHAQSLCLPCSAGIHDRDLVVVSERLHEFFTFYS